MEVSIILSILNRIRSLVEDDSISNAKDLIRIEIENLEGIAERKW